MSWPEAFVIVSALVATVVIVLGILYLFYRAGSR